MVPFLDMNAMTAEVRTAVDECWKQTLSSGRFIGGPFVDGFEEKWAAYCQTRHCVGVSDGTAALELAMSALGIGAGDEVIVPTNTFIATASAVTATGARPVFVDVDPATLLLTEEHLRAAITSKTAAVIVVHLYGQPANMEAIAAVAEAARICVIEDAAQAHGATWNGRKAGSFAAAGCFSFYPGKNLGAFGDAGAVVTDDSALADKIRALSNHGRRHDDPYTHDLIGGTRRLDALQAAVLTAKLERLDAWNAGRQRVARRYAEQLSELPVDLVRTDPRAVSSQHLMVVQVDGRDEVRQELHAQGISTGIHYPIPCHRQVAFANADAPNLPVSERAAERLLSLPMFPHMEDWQITRVVERLGGCLIGNTAKLIAAD